MVLVCHSILLPLNICSIFVTNDNWFRRVIIEIRYLPKKRRAKCFKKMLLYIQLHIYIVCNKVSLLYKKAVKTITRMINFQIKSNYKRYKSSDVLNLSITVFARAMDNCVLFNKLLVFILWCVHPYFLKKGRLLAKLFN